MNNNKHADEKDYIRKKRYRMKHAEKIRAKHDAWIDSHRREWNAYMRDYRFRKKIGLPGGKKHPAEAKKQVTGSEDDWNWRFGVNCEQCREYTPGSPCVYNMGGGGVHCSKRSHGGG